MRIGIVCYPTYGGSGVVATEMGLGLAAQGHDVHFISYSRPARLTGFHSNIYLHEVQPPDYPLFDYVPYESALASRIVDVALNNNLDIVHVHYAIPHATVAYLAKKILLTQGKYIPVVTTLHGSDITLVGIDPIYKSVVEFSIGKSDGITAVSNFLRESTHNNFSIDCQIEVIYNFIDLSKFKRVYKDHFYRAIAPNGEFVVTHISNFREVKRVGDTLRAFNEVQKKIPSTLLMVGDGPERTKMEALCRELGICQKVKFFGKQEAVDEILSVSDVFFMPSGNESFGLAALEAMACEVPVISSNAGGLPELNRHEETGFVCDIGDIDAYVKALLILGEDRLRLQTFSQNAIKRAQEFDINNILPKYERFYEETITKALL